MAGAPNQSESLARVRARENFPANLGFVVSLTYRDGFRDLPAKELTPACGGRPHFHPLKERVPQMATSIKMHAGRVRRESKCPLIDTPTVTIEYMGRLL